MHNVTLRCVHATIVTLEKQFITNSLCVVVCGIQHAVHMHHTVICGPLRSIIFSHIISLTVQFSEKKVTELKMCFDFLYNFSLKHFSF